MISTCSTPFRVIHDLHSTGVRKCELELELSHLLKSIVPVTVVKASGNSKEKNPTVSRLWSPSQVSGVKATQTLPTSALGKGPHCLFLSIKFFAT
jgi:hypothetical protein